MPSSSLPLKFTLLDGTSIPALGLGTWRAAPGVVSAALHSAIVDSGYRHIDCAPVYENQAEIGTALKDIIESGAVKREDLYIVSKLWVDQHEDIAGALDETLRDLQLDYLDLYVIHWPIHFGHADKERKNGSRLDYAQIWGDMEKLVAAGKVRSIGLSNCRKTHIEEVLKVATTAKPVVNQVEMHPYLQQDDLVAFCKQHGIVVTAYSPLGSSGFEPAMLEDSTLVRIAKEHDTTPAIVALSWNIQRGVGVIPKSSNPDRLRQNTSIVTLSEQDMSDIANIGVVHRYFHPNRFWGAQADFMINDP
ncbi:aldo/keto reductase [Ramicandelaber brevisporus]|nr:aldo/keto reductase [Ramicandelaber brevisporus]